MDNWTKTAAAAAKVLGDKAQVPAIPSALSDGVDKGRKSIDAVKAMIAEMQAGVITMQKACGDVVRAGHQAQSAMAKENFGLDPKNPDDAKKIQKARALFDAYLSKATKTTGDALMPMTKFENSLGSFAKEIGA